jgi:CMP-N-acetylneuraminic acid synthetase
MHVRLEGFVLAVIPARGGSKRLPGKNVTDLGGKPLIVHTIEAARACPSVDRVVVTTDDAAIARVSAKAGAEVVERPADLATDDATLGPVCRHALLEMERRDNRRYGIVAALQPTSPFRDAGHIAAAVALLRGRDCDSVVSVCPPRERPERARIIVDGELRFLDPTSVDPPPPSRHLPPVYYLNGALYVADRAVLIERNDVRGIHIAPLIMTPEESIDIDTLLDLELADAVLRRRAGSTVSPSQRAPRRGRGAENVHHSRRS